MSHSQHVGLLVKAIAPLLRPTDGSALQALGAHAHPSNMEESMAYRRAWHVRATHINMC